MPKYKPSQLVELLWAMDELDEEQRIIHLLNTLTATEADYLRRGTHTRQLASDRLRVGLSWLNRDSDRSDHVAGCEVCMAARLKMLSEEKAAHDQVCDDFYCRHYGNWRRRCKMYEAWRSNVGTMGIFNRERHAHALAAYDEFNPMAGI